MLRIIFWTHRLALSLRCTTFSLFFPSCPSSPSVPSTSSPSSDALGLPYHVPSLFPFPSTDHHSTFSFADFSKENETFHRFFCVFWFCFQTTFCRILPLSFWTILQVLPLAFLGASLNSFYLHIEDKNLVHSQQWSSCRWFSWDLRFCKHRWSQVYFQIQQIHTLLTYLPYHVLHVHSLCGRTSFMTI